jgi:uncharacterized protein (DUF305 family)
MFISMFLISLLMTPLMVNHLSDYRLSLNHAYMAAFMGFAMVILEGTMHPMPAALWALSIAGLIAAVAAYRTQFLVSDREWLHDMIPHHSMAVLTSQARMERSQNKRIKQLAEQILATQNKEIALMKLL